MKQELVSPNFLSSFCHSDTNSPGGVDDDAAGGGGNKAIIVTHKKIKTKTT